MTAASSPPPQPLRAGIGEPLRRLEDARLLTGRGCYSDDFNLAGQVYAVVV
jgi:carbon-monoxide dehydrogenase large subunit